METTKRRFGDRKDGKLLRDLDGMHFIVPLLYPNRCDNEAFISELIDLTNANAYLAKKNDANPEEKYTLFQLIVTAMMKCLYLRPKMNRFIANKNTYQRNEITSAFVIKKEFKDNAAEGLAVIHSDENSTLDSIRADIEKCKRSTRSGKVDKSSDQMDIFNKMPRFFSKFIVWIITRLDVHGWVPKSLIETDPYYCSVVLTNLGSIKLHSGYHHLTNWGTNSVFVAIGERKVRPFCDDEGNITMKSSVDIGLTVDERIADGHYYSKTVRLLKTLLENPELLEAPLCTEVEY